MPQNPPIRAMTAEERLDYDRRHGRRRCGLRIAGGIYWVTQAQGMFPSTENMQYFLAQPIPIDVEALGVSPIGVTLIERNGVTHVIDWVGEEHYPTANDFIEEVRAMGLSRRLPRTLDFSRLCEDSRILLVHRRCVTQTFLRDNSVDGPAIFGSFPATALDVIEDQNDSAATERAGNAACNARNIPVRTVRE